MQHFLRRSQRPPTRNAHGGPFRAHQCHQLRWQIKKQKMISNSKQNCIDSLNGSLTRTANWRRGLDARYNDPRNGRAADTLAQLARETKSLTDEAWGKLQNFYNWSSPTWSEAVSAASRQVGFRNVNTLPAFVSALLGLLSEQH
jgi:hypothetical protein